MSEYMTAQEALAWVETGDAAFSASVATARPNGYALRVAEWVVEGRSRSRKTSRALRLIQERCASGRIVAYARPISASRREMMKPADWVGIRLNMNFELTDQHGWPVFAEPVFRRKDVHEQFAVPVRGRPASKSSASPLPQERQPADDLEHPTVDVWPTVDDKVDEHVLPWFISAEVDEAGAAAEIASPEAQPVKLTLPKHNLYTALIEACGPSGGFNVFSRPKRVEMAKKWRLARNPAPLFPDLEHLRRAVQDLDERVFEMGRTAILK